MTPNLQWEKCAKCDNGKGEIPIADDLGNMFWICEYCDAELFEDVTYRVEGLKDGRR